MKLSTFGTYLLLSSFCFNAQASGFRTGDEIYRGLVEFQENDKTVEGIMSVGYVVGQVDSLSASETICLPERSTIGQVVQVVKNYLAQHPEEWNFQAANSVQQGLKNAWPCPWSKYKGS